MTVAADYYAEVVIGAEAIEHALHLGLIANLEQRSDREVVDAIAAVAREAADVPGGLAALFAADYADDPGAFPARMNAALTRSAHMHHDENGGTQHV